MKHKVKFLCVTHFNFYESSFTTCLCINVIPKCFILHSLLTKILINSYKILKLIVFKL